MGRPRTVSDDVVLAGAAEAVADLGPSALTLADIGVRVGLSPATLLQRFGSKRGLLLALARHDADALPARLRAAAAARAPVAALVDQFASMAGTVRTSAQFANHLAFLLLDLSDPEFQQVTRTYAAAVEAAIVEVLRASRAVGELRDLPAAEVRRLARAVHAAYNGALVTWGMTGGGRADTAVRAQLTAVLGPRLATPPPRHRRTRGTP